VVVGLAPPNSGNYSVDTGDASKEGAGGLVVDKPLPH